MKNSTKPTPLLDAPNTSQPPKAPHTSQPPKALTKGDEKSHVVERKEAALPKKLDRKPSEDINASADAFIKKFRQQLLIQRLESIENYEQMLERGL